MDIGFSNKIKNGFLWGVGFSLALFVALSIFNWLFISEPKKDYIEIAEQVAEFKVLNESNRIVRSTNNSSYLVITGEIESDTFSELNSILITAELRDESGTFIDSCFESITLLNKRTKISFKIKCPDINNETQFSSYEFNIQGLRGKFT